LKRIPNGPAQFLSRERVSIVKGVQSIENSKAYIDPPAAVQGLDNPVPAN
jgi:hypothetical protein